MAFLVDKCDLQRFFEAVLDLCELRHGVIEDVLSMDFEVKVEHIVDGVVAVAVRHRKVAVVQALNALFEVDHLL